MMKACWMMAGLAASDMPLRFWEEISKSRLPDRTTIPTTYGTYIRIYSSTVPGRRIPAWEDLTV